MRPLLIVLLLVALPLAGCAETPPPLDDDAGSAEPDVTTTPTAPADGADGPPADDEPADEETPVMRGPDWTLAGVDGETYTRDMPPADATVLFFFATWCGTCMSKAPGLGEVQDAYVDDGVRFLSVDIDPSETAQQVEQWQARYGHEWGHGIDNGQTMMRLFDVKATSYVVVLDAHGNVVKTYGDGEVTKDDLSRTLDETLAA